MLTVGSMVPDSMRATVDAETRAVSASARMERPASVRAFRSRAPV